MHRVESNYCQSCGKLKQGVPFWMVIPQGEEYKYICQCGLWSRYVDYFEGCRPIKRLRVWTSNKSRPLL